MKSRKAETRYDKIKVDCGCKKGVFACREHSQPIPAAHTPTRCKECRWVHEGDTIKQTSYMGVEFCALHNRYVNAHEDILKSLSGIRNDILSGKIQRAVATIDTLLSKAEASQ